MRQHQSKVSHLHWRRKIEIDGEKMLAAEKFAKGDVMKKL
jgi:hypothetical protein